LPLGSWPLAVRTSGGRARGGGVLVVFHMARDHVVVV
jgi:hypothetical protein